MKLVMALLVLCLLWPVVFHTGAGVSAVGVGGSGCSETIHDTPRYPEDCPYYGRRIEDMDLHWSIEFGDHLYTEVTYRMGDGEGGIVNPWPVQTEGLWFMMDMRWTRVYKDHGLVGYHGRIVEYDPVTWDTLRTLKTPHEWDGSSGLAFHYWDGFPDPGPSFWYTVLDSTNLYHVDDAGELLGSYPIGMNNVTGLALDKDNDHLWAVIRGEPDMLVECDVSTGVPALLQDPFPVLWSDGSSWSAAGLDYDEDSNLLIAINATSGSKELFRDLDPDYAGPAGSKGPGVRLEYVCGLTQTPHVWGVAHLPISDAAFAAANPPYPPNPPYPLDEYGPELVGIRDSNVERAVVMPRLRVFPSPLDSSARFACTLPRPGHARLVIYGATGRRVRLLFDDVHPAGTSTVVWDGLNGDGIEVPAGIYFARLECEGRATRASLTLVR